MRMICEFTSYIQAFVPTKKRVQRNDADEPISRLHTGNTRSSVIKAQHTACMLVLPGCRGKDRCFQLAFDAIKQRICIARLTKSFPPTVKLAS
jgi:hypothetical protein